MADIKQGDIPCVPGLYRCPRCNFTLHQLGLDASNGDLLTDDKPGEKCPNDGSPLWRVTRREVDEFVAAKPAPTERLDFDKPPPRYKPHPYSTERRFAHAFVDENGRTVSVTEFSLDAAEGIRDAWLHYKTYNDPPSAAMEYMRCGPDCPGWDTVDEARAAMWAWYQRRLDLESSDGALLEDHDGAPVPAAPVWPRCLSWSDDQVAAVERWIAEGGALPELLRERRLDDGSTEMVEVDGTEYVIVGRIDIRRADYDWARSAGVPPLEALAWAYGPRPLPAARHRPVITYERAADPAELERKLIEWQRNGAPMLLGVNCRVEVHHA